jgi:hypothetical protein
MPEILDTNRNSFGHYDALKAAGVKTVIRYIAAGLESHEKVIKEGEAHAIADAGLRLGLVYEINGRPSGGAVGARDGVYARAYAPKVGAPAGAIIWYTVDWDAGRGDLPGIAAAFRAFKNALEDPAVDGPGYRTGCYASGYICDQLYNAGLCDARWLTDSRGFAGTRDSINAGRYELLQALPQDIAGLDTDPDARYRAADGRVADIGDFVPFASTDDPVYPQPGQAGV